MAKLLDGFAPSVRLLQQAEVKAVAADKSLWHVAVQ